MPVFALTIGWSAFLLFWIEPLVGQLVLPAFGGAPAVWATVLVFFQAVLLLGYLYGHVSTVRLSPRQGAAVHGGLALAALAWLAVGSIRTADIGPSSLPAPLDVLRVLALTVGPPVFILTTTTPLVSAWYARWRGRSASDPYWLYALSNGGSLVALLGYPFLIGPRFGLAEQRPAWAVGFAVLVAALIATAVLAARVIRPAAPAPISTRRASSRRSRRSSRRTSSRRRSCGSGRWPCTSARSSSRSRPAAADSCRRQWSPRRPP